METMKKETADKPVLAKIAEKLLLAQQELDELTVQLALGKAEARDKFEELKKTFKQQVDSFRSTMEVSELSDIATRLKTRLDELEVQLALGKAETKEIFESQRAKILHSLQAFEQELEKHLSKITHSEDIYHEIEKFKLKLEILRLKFVLKKFVIKESFREKMKEAGKKVNNLMKGSAERWRSGKTKVSDFRDELQLAYKHLRKAIESF